MDERFDLDADWSVESEVGNATDADPNKGETASSFFASANFNKTEHRTTATTIGEQVADNPRKRLSRFVLLFVRLVLLFVGLVLLFPRLVILFVTLVRLGGALGGLSSFLGDV